MTLLPALTRIEVEMNHTLSDFLPGTWQTIYTSAETGAKLIVALIIDIEQY